MTPIENIMQRHSTRNFIEGRVVPDSDIQIILKCACQAPSAMNKQPWSFIVIKDSLILKALQDAHPYAGFLTAAGCAIVIVADSANAWEDYWKVDPLLAAQNILLSAYDLGLGTCWCGVYPNPQRMQDIANVLGIPEPYQAMALIALGYPEHLKTDNSSRFTTQKVHYNRW